MSKSRGNAIAIGATADETAALIRRAKTDTTRQVTYEPERRPEVANLLLLASLCQGRDPHAIAAEIGDGGGSGLKRVVTESVNELLAPVRARREAFARERGYVREVLRSGNARANELADACLDEVRSAMGMLV